MIGVVILLLTAPKPPAVQVSVFGSGVIVSNDGYILTNYHVVKKYLGKIKIKLGGDRVYNAKIIGTDPKTNIAVLKINAKNLSYFKFGDSDTMGVGDVVFTVGNPFGVGKKVIAGVISDLGISSIGIADYEDFIQIDTTINPMNSGSALINAKGELIGINTAILTRRGKYEGVGFAIPSNMAKRIFYEIKEKGKVERGWIGVAIQDIKKLVVVVDVVSGGPAEVAGLQREDILYSVNGIQLKNKGQLRNIVAKSGIGNSVELKIERNGEFIRVPVKIVKLPEDMNFFDVKNFSFPAK